MALAEGVAVGLLGKVLEKGAGALNELRKESRADRVKITDADARSCLLAQVNSVAKWADSISLLSLLRDKKLKESFVELSLDVGLVRRVGTADRTATVRLSDIYHAPGHFVILGRPGAGKTTSLQRIANLALTDWENGAGGIPVLVRLRDLRGDDTLVTHLLGLWGIDVRVPTGASSQLRRAWQLRVALSYLASISGKLLVDGLDETSFFLRASVETQLRDIALAPGDHRLFLTCRTADFHVQLQNVQAYTIRPLTPPQVEDFAGRWLGQDEAPKFLNAVQRNPYSGAEVVPLTLAHLCAIYERDGELPPRPIDVYEQIVSLLVEEWDKQRGVRRASRYADFSWRKKERFLQAVAYELALKGRKGSFHEDDLATVYGAIAPDFNLPPDEARAVISEIESHTGLVQESGHRRYDFVHLVIQEFLTAMHAHRKANAVETLIPSFPNELALVVAYSPGPEDYLERILEVLYQRLHDGIADEFLVPFISRLVIERPTWRSTARSGWVFVGYFDLITRYHLAVHGKADLRFPGEVSRLLRVPAVADAITWAAFEADRFETDRAFRLVPNPHASLPPFMSDYLRGRPDAGVVLLRSERRVRWIMARKRQMPASKKRERLRR